MAQIHSLSIKHYRGIEEFYQVFNTRTVVLIGRGDSGKSTILHAIQSVLHPRWNFSFTDVDFTNCDTSKPIEIEVEMIDIPEELMRDSKFGMYLGVLRQDGTVSYDIEAEEGEERRAVLCVRLEVKDDLEPKWYVVSRRPDQSKVEISGADRALFNAYMVSDYVDNHFSYNRLSPLHRLLRQSLENANEIDRLLASVVRSAHSKAVEEVDLSMFEESLGKVVETAKTLGLDVADIKALLEYKENAFTESNFSLHVGNVPYRLYGKGSKRLLSVAIQQTMIDEGGIVLIDEIEQGLEPDRIRHITRGFKNKEQGQVFYTTHSRDAIIEPDVSSIYVMKKGERSLRQLDGVLQGVIRAQPDAFFAKRVIFCEGATEVGIVRAFDKAICEAGQSSCALKGIVVVDAGGHNKFFDYAMKMTDAGFDCMVFCDDDNRDVYEMRDAVIARGDITLVMCDNGKAIEQQLFANLPDDKIIEIVQYVVDNMPDKEVLPPVGLTCVEEYTTKNHEEKEGIRAIWGDRAKSKAAWYKNIEHGEMLGRVWLEALPQMEGTTLKREYDAITAWMNS